MKTPNQTIDELTHFNLFIELWNDEELREAIKSVSQKNEIKESVLKLKPLFDEMVSDLFEGYFLAAKKDVEKWIDVWENKEFLPTDEVNENLKYWRESLKNDRQYNYFLNSVKSGWVRDNSPMNSKAELIKNANSVFYSGVRLMHENGSCAKAEPTLEDHYNLAITFVKDNCRWVYHHAKITTINKYLSGKLSNEPTAKAKPKFNLRQIALIYVYRNEQISDENANSIAMQYGYKSGQKLQRHYNQYFKTRDRTGDEGTKRKNENKYNFIESVLPYLEGDEKNKAKNELEIINRNYL
jgi:hypothetical protein